MNLLTEDNLPHYYHAIESVFGSDEPWGFWSRRWTAEEGRHSIVIRDYLTVTRPSTRSPSSGAAWPR